MIPDPAETLRIFFEIPHEVIARDIARAEADYVGLTDEIAAVEGVPHAERTPQSEAHERHLLMVSWKKTCRYKIRTDLHFVNSLYHEAWAVIADQIETLFQNEVLVHGFAALKKC